MRTLLLALIAAAMPVMSARAQTPAPAQPPAAAPAAAQPPASTTVPGQASPAAPAAELAPESYAYEPAGRRDPFLNLLSTGSDAAPAMMGRRGEGPAGMSVAEISVRGIMQSHGALIAMIEGADKKTYVVHQGDKFIDGAIKTITPQGLIVVQEINDPLSLVKHREIRKLLRSIEDAK
jgi:Tfp pilus assembly protein PilP